MYKKLIFLAASATFVSAAQASDQTNPDSTKTIAAPLQTDRQPDGQQSHAAVKKKASAQVAKQSVIELGPIIVTSPLQIKASEAGTPVTVLSDDLSLIHI